MGELIALAVMLPPIIAAAIAWANAIEKCTKDPEWQAHKDDPDYWDFP